MNLKTMIKLMNAKNEFIKNHPKFMAFLNCALAKGIEEGTVIEIIIRKPGGEALTANLKVQQSDQELFQELFQELKG